MICCYDFDIFLSNKPEQFLSAAAFLRNNNNTTYYYHYLIRLRNCIDCCYCQQPVLLLVDSWFGTTILLHCLMIRMMIRMLCIECVARSPSSFFPPSASETWIPPFPARILVLFPSVRLYFLLRIILVCIYMYMRFVHSSATVYMYVHVQWI